MLHGLRDLLAYRGLGWSDLLMARHLSTRRQLLLLYIQTPTYNHDVHSSCDSWFWQVECVVEQEHAGTDDDLKASFT